ncbi:sensor histidine kinase [Paenilisteria rocourtiae]|uniref:Two-component system sensor histidine kinase AgrC n=1 Tax=Listeria rocourtiae TaxID=647910 RepID=A0A4V3DPI2_9LIST|nr:GHKL domain-containing protein [Listeria rocourtiae]EUJ52156.1 accessory gene regulator protein C [Listeria rocourtiae FSL F6-920]TDR52436.1 two-component system sensor histidine kinase AgrC [Listeria rocourtiae]
MATVISCITQIIYFLVGVQVISRIKFSWKLTSAIAILLMAVAIPLLFFISYLSVLFIMLVLFGVLYVKSKSITMSIISVIGAFIITIVAYALAYVTMMIISSFTELVVTDDSFIEGVLIFMYVCILLKIIDTTLSKRRNDVAIQGKYLSIIVIISSITLFLFYIYIWQGSISGFSDETLKTNATVFLVYAGIMGIVLGIVVKNAVKSARLEAQALQMSQLREYVGALEALQKDMRVFRHDYVNILSGINGFITNSDMDGLSVYFRTKVIPMNSDMEVNISKLSTLQNLEVIELKGLFATKMIRAQELGVDAQVEVYKRIDEMNMDSLDLCRVAGILLDNAIEAVVDTDDPTIRVAIIQKKEAIVLIFANSLPENSPPIHQFFEEGFSTKGDNRGIGLSTLKNTLKKYPNVSLDTKITQHGFVQELEIG